MPIREKVSDMLVRGSGLNLERRQNKVKRP
jgi:hypothetical protein